MFAKIVVTAVLSLGLAMSAGAVLTDAPSRTVGIENPSAQPSCCIKHSYCCSEARACCPGEFLDAK